MKITYSNNMFIFSMLLCKYRPNDIEKFMESFKFDVDRTLHRLDASTAQQAWH